MVETERFIGVLLRGKIDDHLVPCFNGSAIFVPSSETSSRILPLNLRKEMDTVRSGDMNYQGSSQTIGNREVTRAHSFRLKEGLIGHLVKKGIRGPIGCEAEAELHATFIESSEPFPDLGPILRTFNQTGIPASLRSFCGGQLDSAVLPVESDGNTWVANVLGPATDVSFQSLNGNWTKGKVALHCTISSEVTEDWKGKKPFTVTIVAPNQQTILQVGNPGGPVYSLTESAYAGPCEASPDQNSIVPITLSHIIAGGSTDQLEYQQLQDQSGPHYHAPNVPMMRGSCLVSRIEGDGAVTESGEFVLVVAPTMWISVPSDASVSGQAASGNQVG